MIGKLITFATVAAFGNVDALIYSEATNSVGSSPDQESKTKEWVSTEYKALYGITGAQFRFRFDKNGDMYQLTCKKNIRSKFEIDGKAQLLQPILRMKMTYDKWIEWAEKKHDISWWQRASLTKKGTLKNCIRAVAKKDEAKLKFDKSADLAFFKSIMEVMGVDEHGTKVIPRHPSCLLELRNMGLK